MRCPLTHCRAQMSERVDRLGRLSWDCPWCARRKAGVCRHCPRLVFGTIGRSHFCVECRAERKKVVRKIWLANNKERTRKWSRRWRRKHVKQHREACKKWRENNKAYNTIRVRAYRWSKRGQLAPAKPMTRSEAGKLGGKLGAAARMAAIGPERVREIALNAGRARWEKYRRERGQ